MLPFLHDQNFEQTPADKTTQNDKADQQYLTVATQSQRTRKSTVLLAVLFAFGLLGLVLMIKKSSPQAASAADAAKDQLEIESAIARLTGAGSEMFNRMDEIVKKFYEFSGVPQVLVDELKKNPFQFESFMAGLKSKIVATQSDLGIDPDAIRRQQMAQQAKKLHLLSIMRSDRGNCCMIDDKVLYEGDSIQDFKVAEIAENSVRLRWNISDGSTPSAQQSIDLEIVLRLSE